MGMPVSIMIVENNNDLRNTLRHAFEDRGYLTWTCPVLEIASSIFEAIQPSIVILDLDLEGQNILDLIESWRRKAPHTRVIVESEKEDAFLMREALMHGAQAFLTKPYSLPP